MLSRRRAGVLLHISSLPNNYGIGSLGKEAFDFIDYLNEAEMSYWQFLPLNAIFSDPSPYASISSAGYNLYLISLEKLIDIDLLKEEDIEILKSDDDVNYETLFPLKRKVLKIAYGKFEKNTKSNLYSEYLEFCNKNQEWLDDFAFFITLKEYFIYKRKRDRHEHDIDEYVTYVREFKDRVPNEKIDKFFYEGYMFTWPNELKYRDANTLSRYHSLLSETINFYKFTQFIFYKQFYELHEYAKQNNIKLIGDIPMYVSDDCVDMWVHPELFFLDEKLIPTKVAGVPPDYFSKTGQLWGNPLYNWETHKKQNYNWWKIRFENLFKLTDVIRIDHFRAFDKYWSVPYKSDNAKKGHWEIGPRSDFFDTLFERTTLPIIAEDLGIINNSVRNLRNEFQLPGMFVAQFHLLNYWNLEQINKKISTHTICYTGTHDNETIKGWLETLPRNKKVKVASFIKANPAELSSFDLIKICAQTKMNTLIIPLQDILELDDSARMNIPGTTENNWSWRFKKNMLDANSSKKIRTILEETNRLPDENNKVRTTFENVKKESIQEKIKNKILKFEIKKSR